MSALLTVNEALAMIPGWDPAEVEIESLEGGLTNRSFVVHYAGDDYVLRLDGTSAATVHLNRTAEAMIQSRAHADGLAPELFYTNASAGVMLREYLPGRAWTEGDMYSFENLESLATLIRRVHDLP